jgi:Zn-finger nucleic acid-binding protein
MREREREVGDGRLRELVVIDVCPSCGGVWLDAGELDKLTAFDDRRAGRGRRDDDDRGRGDDDDDGGGFFGRLFGGLRDFGD